MAWAAGEWRRSAARRSAAAPGRGDEHSLEGGDFRAKGAERRSSGRIGSLSPRPSTPAARPKSAQAAADAKTEPPPNFYEFVLLVPRSGNGARTVARWPCEAAPHEGRHPTNSYASASPTTDGERIYVSFGSRGVYCFDMAGNQKWKRDLGKMRTRLGWGEASTPVVHGDSVVVNWDHEGPSFITVLDAPTGETKWKVDRDEPTSWATPLVVEHEAGCK